MADELINNYDKAQDIRKAASLNAFQRMSRYFGFTTVKQDGGKLDVKLTQPEVMKLSKDTKASDAIKFTGLGRDTPWVNKDIEQLFKNWMDDVANTYANPEERGARIDALKFLHDNNIDIKNSTRLMSTEVAKVSTSTPFCVISEDPNWDAYINGLINDIWHLDRNFIYCTAQNLFLFGESFEGLDIIASSGVVSVNRLGVSEVVEKLEFRPNEINNFIAQMHTNPQNSSGFTATIPDTANMMFASNIQYSYSHSLQNNKKVYQSTSSLLADYINNLGEVAMEQNFQTHLLGYRLQNDTLSAPWQIVHGKIDTGISEYYPYGCPPLMACLPAFRQLQRSMGLDDIRKTLSLPIILNLVNTKGLNASRAYELVNEVKQRFENTGLTQQVAGVEGPSLCTNIWSGSDLMHTERLTAESANSDIDLHKQLDSKIQGCTLIPKTYIDPNAEGFQMSGVALSQLFAPFKNEVDFYRDIICDMVAQIIDIHCVTVGKAQPKNYVVTMNADNPTSTEDLRGRLDVLEPISGVVANILGVSPEELPKGVKRDLAIRYANLGSEELDKWEAILSKEGTEEVADVSQDDMDAGFGDGGSMDFGGGDDMGGGEPSGGEEAAPAEESHKRRNLDKKALFEKRRRITEEYKVLRDNSTLDYLLAESLGTVKTKKSTYLLARHNQNYKDMKEYFKNIKYKHKLSESLFLKRYGKPQLKEYVEDSE